MSSLLYVCGTGLPSAVLFIILVARRLIFTCIADVENDPTVPTIGVFHLEMVDIDAQAHVWFLELGYLKTISCRLAVLELSWPMPDRGERALGK